MFYNKNVDIKFKKALNTKKYVRERPYNLKGGVMVFF